MCTHGWWRVMELRTYKSLHIRHPGELTKNADTQGSTSRDPDSAAPSGAWAFVLLLNPPWWSPKRIYPSPLWGSGWGSQVLKMHTLAEHVLAFPRLSQAPAFSFCSLTSFSYSHPQAFPGPQASHTLVHGFFSVPSTWKPCPPPPPLPTTFPWHIPNWENFPSHAAPQAGLEAPGARVLCLPDSVCVMPYWKWLLSYLSWL